MTLITEVQGTAEGLAAAETYMFRAGRDMPPGAIRWRVDCSVNPLNILMPAQRIVDAIKERRRELGPGKKLVVIMGELHCSAAHILLQKMVAQLLKRGAETQNFTMSFERAYNAWWHEAKERGIAVPEELKYDFLHHDPKGEAALTCDLRKDGWRSISELELYKYCYVAEIRSQFNDVSLVNDGSCDMQDPATCQVAKQLGHSLPGRFLPESPRGMAIRNVLMAERALQHSAHHKSDIVVQTTGLAHIFGEKSTAVEEELPYRESLAARFQECGVDVLPVFITHRRAVCGLNSYPEAAAETIARSGLCIDGLDESLFNNGPRNEYSEFERNHIIDIQHASQNALESVGILADTSNYRNISAMAVQRLIERYLSDCAMHASL